MIGVVVLVVAALFAVALYRLWRKDGDEPALHAFDGLVDGGTPQEVGVCTALAFEVAMEAKDKFGEMRYNNANRLVVGEFVREYLRTKYPDLRVVDRVKHSTYAVELALTPTQFALACQRYGEHRAVRERRGVPLPK